MWLYLEEYDGNGDDNTNDVLTRIRRTRTSRRMRSDSSSWRVSVRCLLFGGGVGQTWAAVQPGNPGNRDWARWSDDWRWSYRPLPAWPSAKQGQAWGLPCRAAFPTGPSPVSQYPPTARHVPTNERPFFDLLSTTHH